MAKHDIENSIIGVFSISFKNQLLYCQANFFLIRIPDIVIAMPNSNRLAGSGTGAGIRSDIGSYEIERVELSMKNLLFKDKSVTIRDPLSR